MSTYQIVCDGLGKRRHDPILLGVIHDAWAAPWPATRERQAEHAALSARVLGERSDPAPIVEPVRGLLIFPLHYKAQPRRDSEDVWRWADHIRRDGDRIVLACPRHPVGEVELREVTLTERLRGVEAGDVLLRTLAG